jgi:hypothetical protein
MASCTLPTIPSFIRENGELSISEKYIRLMQDTLGEGSLYERTKETLFHQFEDLQLTEKEKAGFVVDFMSKVAVELSKSSMVTALSWAKEERDGAYTLAKMKADTETAFVQVELVKEQICEMKSKTGLICAQTTATLASSIRDNGRVKTYIQNDDGTGDTCMPNTLEDDGLKYHQIKQVEGATYQLFADAYRKSGVVQVGIDTNDNVRKGLTGNTHKAEGELAGYTAQQTANAERQRIAYEDSKRNHAANSTASMMGQMLSAEVSPSETDVQRWREAVDFLNKSHSSTDNT